MDTATLREVQSIYGAGFGRLGDAEKVRNLLKKVSSRKDVRAAPWLLPVAHSPNSDIQKAARLAISVLFKDIPVHLLPGVEQSARGSYQLGVEGQAYRDFSPNQLLPAGTPAYTHTLGLASFHPNGYVRQRACELLDIRGLRYLLLRANDWVPEVRNVTALSLVRLAQEGPREWVQCLPLVERLRDCSRTDHEAFVEFVMERLRHYPDVLLKGIQKGSHHVRGPAYRLVVDVVESPLTLLLQALEDPNVTIRNWAVDRGMECLEDPRELLAVARRNKAPSVRYRAFLASRKLDPDRTEPFQEALLDRNRSVREYAQFVMKKHGFDLAQHYRTHLHDSPQAILGLAEIGQKPGDEALGMLEQENYSYRKAAIQALGQMGSNREVFLKPLLSADRRLSKRAARELGKKALDRERLWKLWEETDRPHVRENIGWLLMGFGHWWEQTVDRVRLFREADSPLREQALEKLQQGVRAGPYLPPEPARQYIRESLPFLTEVRVAVALSASFGIASSEWERGSSRD